MKRITLEAGCPIGRFLFAVVAAFVAGCGGGEGGSGSTPSVSSVDPIDGASGVEPTTAVSANFSKDMFADTIDGGSFTLSDASGALAGTVSFDAVDNIATFTPADRLTLLGRYTASLSGTITDLNGNALEPMSWSFTTRDGVWGQAAVIENNDGGDAGHPQIAIDADGDAIAVWWQSDGTHASIWANRFTVGSGWGTATRIESDDSGDAYSPQIAFDAEGNALVVWVQSDSSSRWSIWGNRYTPDTGWGTAALLENDDAGDAESPQIAADGSGALAVWRQSDGTLWNIVACRYTTDGGWGTPGLVESKDTGNAYGPQVAFDAEGNALAVWHQHDGSAYSILSNRYSPDGGWDSAELIETASGHATSPRLGIDADGNAIAVWAQFEGTQYNVRANRYTVNGGWGEAELIENDDAGDAFRPNIAVGADGNALAVWGQSDGTRFDILANRYTAGSGWGTAESIENDDAGVAKYARVSIDADGNALAVWQQSDGTRFNIWSSRYQPANGWAEAVLSENDDAGDATRPQIALDAGGNALAVWAQSDGTRDNTHANRFD